MPLHAGLSALHEGMLGIPEAVDNGKPDDIQCSDLYHLHLVRSCGQDLIKTRHAARWLAPFRLWLARHMDSWRSLHAGKRLRSNTLDCSALLSLAACSCHPWQRLVRCDKEGTVWDSIGI